MKQKPLKWPIRRWAWIDRDGELVVGHPGQNKRIIRLWAEDDSRLVHVEIRPVPKRKTR